MTKRTFKKATGSLLILFGFIAVLFQKSSALPGSNSNSLLDMFHPDIAHADIPTGCSSSSCGGGGDGSCGGCCGDCGGGGGSSDLRLKTNIAPIQNALESIQSIHGVTFNWVDTARGEQEVVGVIAQNVQKVFPQVVSTSQDGYLRVDYGAMVAPLIEAVKTLALEVEALKVAQEKSEERV